MAGRDACTGVQQDSTSVTTVGGTPRSTSAATGGRPPSNTCHRSASTICGPVAVGSVAIISASYGTHPLSTCHAMIPKLYTSLAAVMLPLSSSRTGSIYTSVPRGPISVSRGLLPAWRSTLLPKSASLATGGMEALRSTLSGFTSAWMTDDECRYASPPATSASSFRRSAMTASWCAPPDVSSRAVIVPASRSMTM